MYLLWILYSGVRIAISGGAGYPCFLSGGVRFLEQKVQQHDLVQPQPIPTIGFE